jgi:hypothetical protein
MDKKKTEDIMEVIEKQKDAGKGCFTIKVEIGRFNRMPKLLTFYNACLEYASL